MVVESDWRCSLEGSGEREVEDELRVRSWIYRDRDSLKCVRKKPSLRRGRVPPECGLAAWRPLGGNLAANAIIIADHQAFIGFSSLMVLA